MRHLPGKFFIISAILLTQRVSALPIYGQSDTPAGSAFASACAGTGIYGANGAGSAVNLGGGSPANQTCQSGGTFATASANGIINGNSWSGGATSEASLGVIKLSSSGTGSAGTQFSGGEGNAGWNDMVTINSGLGSGIWYIPLAVNGTMSANGQGALGRLEFAVYKNNSILQPYGNSVNGTAYNWFVNNNTTHNGPVMYSWDYQMVAFQVSDYGPGGTPADTLKSMNVNKTVTFAVPFTDNVPFKLGIWMSDMSSQIASGGTAVPNATSIDFSHTVTWGGKGTVSDAAGNNQLTSFSVNSGSGFDYTTAVVPEPSSMLLLGAGLAGLAAIGARRRS